MSKWGDFAATPAFMQTNEKDATVTVGKYGGDGDSAGFY